MKKALGIRSADVTNVRVFASIKAVLKVSVAAVSLALLGVGGDHSA